MICEKPPFAILTKRHNYLCMYVCMYVCMCVCDAFLLASISPRSEVTFIYMTSIYEALMLLNFYGDWGMGWGLELNFLGFQIEENFWEAN